MYFGTTVDLINLQVTAKYIEMKEQVYNLGFPRVSKLIAYLSLIAVLAFMATFFQDFSHHENKSIREVTYQELVNDFGSLFVMAVR